MEVKHLTKILSVVQKEENGIFDEHLDHIYVYHLQGVGKVRDSGMHQDNKTIMEAHLRSHNSEFCVALYHQDRNNFWLEEGLRMVKTAAEQIGETDLNYTSHRIKDAANIAKLLYRDTGMLSDADEAYLLYSKHVQMRQDLPKNADGARRHKHRFAEQVFKKVFKNESAQLKDKFQWGKRTFNSLFDIIQNGGCGKPTVIHDEMKLTMGRIKHVIGRSDNSMQEKVELMQNLYTMEENYCQVALNTKYVAASNLRMAKLVKYQLNTSDDLKLTQLMANHYDKAGEGFHQIGNKDASFYCLKESTKVWTQLYKAFKDPNLLQRLYISQSLLAQTAENSRTKAIITFHKGLIGQELLRVTNDLTYKSECESALTGFLQYAKSNPTGLESNMRRANGILNSLKRKYNDISAISHFVQ
jgi:hypothetical protein